MRGLKTWLPVVVILVVLAAGYLASAYVRSSDSPSKTDGTAPEATPARTATRTTASRTPTVASTATSLRGATPGATTDADAWENTAPRNLADDESSGGHTLERHIARSDAQLRQRLAREPDISAASTYTDLAIARLAVGAAIAKEQTAVRAWEKRTGERPNLTIRFHTPVVVGRSIERGSTMAVDADDVVVVLRWAGKDWYVLTSYPEVR